MGFDIGYIIFSFGYARFLGVAQILVHVFLTFGITGTVKNLIDMLKRYCFPARNVLLTNITKAVKGIHFPVNDACVPF